MILLTITIIPKPKYAVENESIILGDVDQNKTIDSSDLLLMLRHISASNIGNHPEWILSGDKFKSADVIIDEKIDSNDLLVLLRYIAASKSEEIGKKHPEWLIIDKSTTKIIEAESINLDKSKIDVIKNDKFKLNATILPENTTNKTVYYKSSNEKIAQVTSDGTVKAIEKGTATIIARTTNGKEAICTVNVKESDAKTVNVTSVTLQDQNKTLTVKVGKTATIKVKEIKPSNATNKKIKWTSSNNKIATVNQSGVVKGIKAGTITITASAHNGKKATRKVTVQKNSSSTPSTPSTPTTPTTPTTPSKPSNKKVTGVKLDRKSVKMYLRKNEAIHDTILLQATISPNNATNKAVTWKSSDSSIATVSSNGKVTAKKLGKAVITVTTKDGNFTDKCTVTVVKFNTNIKVTGVSISSSKVTLKVGERKTVTATIKPKNATNQNVIWSIGENAPSGIISLKNKESKTLTITGLKTGATAIQVKTKDGDFIAYCRIEVKPKGTTIVPATKLTISPTSVKKKVNEKFTITAIVSPSNSTDKAIFKSSNSKVAKIEKVESRGKGKYIATVKAVSANKETVKITVEARNQTKKCYVTVEDNKPKIKLSLSPKSKTLNINQTFEVKAITENIGNKKIKWTTTNTGTHIEIIKSDNNGAVIKALKEGNESVKAYFWVGNTKYEDICTIHVNPKTKPKVKAKNIKFNLRGTESERYILKKGNIITLKASIYPVNATNQKITWSSSSRVSITPKSSDTKTITIRGDKKGNASVKAMLDGLEPKYFYIKVN